MKIHELQAVCRIQQADTDEDPFEEEDESEESDQLSIVLSQLENCWALIDALHEHFKVPRSRMTAYFKRELARVSLDAANTLIEYQMTGNEESE